MDKFHTPVLLKEVLEYLKPEKGKKYIDATLGGGGHTREILRLGGEVLGIDLDQEVLDFIRENFKFQISNFKLIPVWGNFREIDQIARLAAKRAHSQDFDKVSGIVFDLGVSSHQLDAKDRGFSFQKEAPLDMRMDKSLKVSAFDLINGLNKEELYELFSKLGEERHARAIAQAVLRARNIKKIETTKELADLVAGVYGHRFKVHPATKVFQALRIAVNSELENLRIALPKAIELLESRGKLLVISFHSLEDRIVKNNFKQFEEEGLGRILTKKPIVPDFEEIERNRRIRSAKLRVFEKK